MRFFLVAQQRESLAELGVRLKPAHRIGCLGRVNLFPMFFRLHEDHRIVMD